MTARTAVNDMDYASYVPLRDTTLNDAMFDADGNPSLTNIRNYANLGDGSNAGVKGRKRRHDHWRDRQLRCRGQSAHSDGGRTVQLTIALRSLNVMANTGVDDIKSRLDSQTELFVKNLKEAKGDNLIAALDEVYDEAIRRAEIELAHYMDQWEDTIDDETLVSSGVER